jgi:hypothetical protein
MFSSPLVRADYNDLSPTNQLALIEAALEVGVGNAEQIQALRDQKEHLELNLAKARVAHPFTQSRGAVTCHRCGAAVPIPKEDTK